MEKYEVMDKITKLGIVAVIRAESSERAKHIIEAVKAGGITNIEITMTIPNALDVLKQVTDCYKDQGILIGVGSILDPETARLAILSGAEYVVSPHLNPDVIKLCNRYKVPCMPGAMTVKEVIEAMEWGADIVKLFPGEILGPQAIKAIKGPLPHASLMPTGGVTLDNVGDWIRAGAVAVGIGGSLTRGATTGDYKLVSETASQFVKKLKEARENSI